MDHGVYIETRSESTQAPAYYVFMHTALDHLVRSVALTAAILNQGILFGGGGGLRVKTRINSTEFSVSLYDKGYD
jgi:hypothetical protein